MQMSNCLLVSWSVKSRDRTFSSNASSGSFFFCVLDFMAPATPRLRWGMATGVSTRPCVGLGWGEAVEAAEVDCAVAMWLAGLGLVGCGGGGAKATPRLA